MGGEERRLAAQRRRHALHRLADEALSRAGQIRELDRPAARRRQQPARRLRIRENRLRQPLPLSLLGEGPRARALPVASSRGLSPPPQPSSPLLPNVRKGGDARRARPAAGADRVTGSRARGRRYASPSLLSARWTAGRSAIRSRWSSTRGKASGSTPSTSIQRARVKRYGSAIV